MNSPLDVLFSDTSEEARRCLYDLLRRASPSRKLAMLSSLNETVRQLALSGLQKRHPTATPQQLQRYLADRVLGSELALQAYGPLPE